MGALVCNVCGGRLVKNAAGKIRCERCGKQHDIEVLKKALAMSKKAPGQMADKIKDLEKIANYLKKAKEAYAVNNNLEAELYCNKIIKMDPTNYEAWLIKGHAVGWQVSLANPRLTESLSAFSEAIINVPANKKQELIDQVQIEIRDISFAFISKRVEDFISQPDKKHLQAFYDGTEKVGEAIMTFEKKMDIHLEEQDLDIMVARQIDKSVMEAWTKTILPAYQGGKYKADKEEWEKFIERVDNCIELLRLAIKLSSVGNIQRYENLIFLQQEVIDSCAYDYDIDDWQNRTWYPEYQLSDKAKELRMEKIRKYQRRIKEIQEEQKIYAN